jgi:hypothetical protein
MKVFISWSGESSKAIAEILRTWLPAVIQAVKPYYSPDDMAKGARWSTEIAKNLEESRVGLICLTRENLIAPWIMFESGALSKNLDKSKVSPLLFGVEPTDLTGPLVQFQATRFEKTEIKRVVRMINGELGDDRLASDVLDAVYDMWWPKLEERVNQAMTNAQKTNQAEVRSQQDILEEVLALARAQARRTTSGSIHPLALSALVDSYRGLVQSARDYNMCNELGDSLEKLHAPLMHLAYQARRRGHLVEHRSVIEELNKITAEFKEATQPSTASTTIDDDDDLPF